MILQHGRGASWAIGGPTLEMWIKSWNEKTKNDAKKAKLLFNESGTGYQVKIDSDESSISVIGSSNWSDMLDALDMMNTTEYGLATNNLKTSSSSLDTSLYYPYKSQTVDECSGYWIASPSTQLDSSLFRVEWGGGLEPQQFHSSTTALRPIVYIER